MWGTPWPGSLCLKKCCLGKSDWQLGHKMANHVPNWPWQKPLVMRFQGPIHPKQKIEFAENRLTWCETNSQAPNAIKSLQIVMLSQQVVSCQEAPIMIYKQGAHTTMVRFLLKYPLTKASYYCYFEWGGRNDVINKRKCKCFFFFIFFSDVSWTFNSFGIWNEWNKWAWDIFAPISVIDRPLTLKSCKIWNSLHSSRSGVAKNIGAPIMPRPFQLFRCPFRFEMSTCGFGEVRQTIRKYFKISRLAIKCCRLKVGTFETPVWCR